MTTRQRTGSTALPGLSSELQSHPPGPIIKGRSREDSPLPSAAAAVRPRLWLPTRIGTPGAGRLRKPELGPQHRPQAEPRDGEAEATEKRWPAKPDTPPPEPPPRGRACLTEEMKGQKWEPGLKVKGTCWAGQRADNRSQRLPSLCQRQRAVCKDTPRLECQSDQPRLRDPHQQDKQE